MRPKNWFYLTDIEKRPSFKMQKNHSQERNEQIKKPS